MNSNEKNKAFVWPFDIENKETDISRYIKNISGKIETYSNGKTHFPVFSNDRSDSWIASIYTIRFYYFKKAIHNTPAMPFRIKMLLKLLLATQFVLSKIASLDHVVYFNHNLCSTTLWPEELENAHQVIANMKKQYPDRAIIFRSLNFVHNEKIIRSLQECEAEMLHFREIFYFNPTISLTKEARYTLRKDLSLIEENGFQLLGKNDLTSLDIAALYELYTTLYIDKHSEKNPQYTADFFETILKDDSYSWIVLKKDNVLHGFTFYETKNNVMQAPALGYDVNSDPKIGVYRQLIAALINASLSKGMQLNFSSGVAQFKQNRGAIKTSDYYLIYIKHLPLIKRMAWKLLLGVFNKSLLWALNIFAKLRNVRPTKP